MSFFNETYNEARSISPEQVTRGKRVSFMEAFDIAFDTQVRGAAAFGIQEAMRNLDDEQRQAMKKAGLEDIPSLSSRADDPLRMFTDFGEDYLNVARFVQNGGTPEMKQRIDEYNAKIGDIRKRYPTLSLMTAEEMWNTVRNKAQEAERSNELMRPDNFVSATGGFLGGLAGSLNPNTDPFNFASLPVGFGGKTIAGRVLTQATGQAGIEAVNQVMGVQEQRQLLGLSNGPIDAAMRVGGAFLGGAVVQGAGEAIGIGVRRLWPQRPGVPADVVPEPVKAKMLALPPPSHFARYPTIEMPPPGVPEKVEVAGAKLAAMPDTFDEYVHLVSPTSTTRIGKMRTNVDIGHVTQQLTDWNGPAPWQIEPKTDTSPVRAQTDFVDIPSIADIVRDGNIDRLARDVDPDVMQRYDSLADEKRVLRANLAEATAGRDASPPQNAALEEVEQQIAILQHKAAKAGAMKAKKYAKQIDELRANRDMLVEQQSKADTPYMAMMRERLVEVDERMRDLAEPVSRAYARARGKWVATEAEHADVVRMMREGSKETRLGQSTDETAAFLPRERTLEEIVPSLQLRDTVEVKADADAADVLSAIIKKQADDLAEVLDSTRNEIKKLLAPVDKKPVEGVSVKMVGSGGTVRIPEVDSEDVIRFQWDNEVSPRAIHIGEVGLPDEMKGKGLGTKAYEGLVQYALKNNAVVHSDTVVSPEAVRVYSSLEKKGYRVERAPDFELRDDGSAVGRNGAFRITGTTTDTIKLPGRDGLLHLDKDHIAWDGEEITVREFLQRQLDNDEDLAAVASCSIV